MAVVYDDQDTQTQTNSEPNPPNTDSPLSTQDLRDQESASTNDAPDATSPEAAEKLQSGLDKVTDKPEVKSAIKDFYNSDSGSGVGKKGAAAGVGALLLGLILAIGGLLGFLNSFSLDNLMSNIEAKSFIRFQVAMDGRSSKWVQAYMTVRLSEDFNDLDADGNPRAQVFRADGVDNNNPLTDWYRTMRSSKFEQDVFNKHGIYFASTRGPDGKFRAVKLTLNGEDVLAGLSDEERDNIKNGRINNISPELRERIFNMETLGNDKAARIDLRQTIRDDTHWWQLVKRRHIRQDIQNRTGIRDWRFFETTRDTIDGKKIDIRNKIVTKAFPDDNKAGKVVQCLFGIQPVAQCRGGADPANPENRSTTAGETGPDREGTPVNEGELNEDGTPRNSAGNVSTELAEKLIKKFIPVANVVDVVGTLDMISASVDSAGNIRGLVSAYKATQAIGFYTTFNIARDQLKTGDVTGEEIGEFMSLANNVSSNEGYATVIAEANNKVSAASEQLQNARNKEEFCNPDFQEELMKPENANRVNDLYIYNCPEKQVGGLSGAATGIEAFFNSPAGTALKALSSAWKAVTDNFFGSVIRAINDIAGKVITAVVQPILSGLGLSDKIEDLTAWAIGKIGEAAGLKSLVDETPVPITGQYINASVQGGAATNENSIRAQGGSITTKETKAEATKAVAMYLQKDMDNQSLITKYASLSNPRSLTSRSLISFNENKQKIAMLPARFSSSIFGLFSFSRPSFAAASPYAASDFAGIQTFDYPKECINADPFKMTPKNSTNIQTIVPGVTDAELTWDVVRDKTAFYDLLYLKLGNDEKADEKAVKVYNCALLDNAVAGGLGGLYGYEADGGLRAGAQEAPPTTAALSGNWVWPIKGNISISSCFAEKLSKGPHPGLDIRANYIPAFAVSDGVVFGQPGGSYGILKIKHTTSDGKVVYSVYEHMSKITVNIGDVVTVGQQIGTTGNTAPPGGSSGPHLHFGMTEDPNVFEYADMGKGKLLNPLYYINDNQPSGDCSASPARS